MPVTGLATALQPLVARIADDVLTRVRPPGAIRAGAAALHIEEHVGDDFDVWCELLAHRIAVLWVLKTVYLRVLEDRGLLTPNRILDPESQQLFAQLAPDLGATAYLRWCFRDLAKGGLAELFTLQATEVVEPGDAVSSELIEFWRHRNPDTHVLSWSFEDERFDGRMMGDLYQDLDPVVKDRYAFCQTPDFVLDLILDQTLEPAMERWGAGEVRLIDPSCGSGHFLLAALVRIVDRMLLENPDRPKCEVVVDALERVHGIDINDYAAALARARLVMTALELCGLDDIREAAQFKPHVYWADALEQVERSKDYASQADLFAGVADSVAEHPGMTPEETRKALSPQLRKKYHVIVGNPPYIVERDAAKKGYHRQKVDDHAGRTRPRYVSAYRQYSLVCLFIERCGQIALRQAEIGMIVGNQFMKREFGRKLITDVLAHQNLKIVIDSANAFIPGHGTPTAILFWQIRAPENRPVIALQGKRGEPGVPADPAQGKVWASIVAGLRAMPVEGVPIAGQVWHEDEFISAGPVERQRFEQHPWSLGGGGASELRAILESRAASTLGEVVREIGRTVHTGEDNVFFMPTAAANRYSASRHVAPYVKGEDVRDYAIAPGESSLFPYSENLQPERPSGPLAEQHFWRNRTVLSARIDYGQTPAQRGLKWFEYSMFFADRFRTPLSIAFAFVATHNHFVLDRGGKVFKQSAPVIKLPETATEEDHLALLGLLNSSVGCFWMKQVFHCKGYTASASGARTGAAEEWENFYEFDGTKAKLFPVLLDDRRQLKYAHALDKLATARTATSATHVVVRHAHLGADALRTAFAARRLSDLNALYAMVALQEEMDWLLLAAYGLVDSSEPVREVSDVVPFPPGQRPFEILLARQDVVVAAALTAGQSPDAPRTQWFSRHGWNVCTDPSVIEEESTSRLVQRRMALIESSKDVGLVEQPEFKRRWYRPDHQAQESEALRSFLSERLETWGRDQPRAFTSRQAAAALETDPAVRAVAEVLTGRRDADLEVLLGELIDSDCVPQCKAHVYKPTGLTRRAVWERTWALQHAEDAGESPGKIPVPPKYATGDFLATSYWNLRGKLDVPKERFIHLSEVPGATGADALYGWAGWTPRQRAKVLNDLDEALEERGVPVEDRHGVLWSLQQQIPFVAWESAEAAREYQAIVTEQVGTVTDKMLTQWAARFPPPRGGGRRKARKKA